MRNGVRYFATFVLCITYGVLAGTAYASDGESVTTAATSSTGISQADDNDTIPDEHGGSSASTSHDGLNDGSSVPSASSTTTTGTLESPTTQAPPDSSSEEEDASEKAPSPPETLKALSPDIGDSLGKAMDFSYLIPFTGGVQLTLVNNSVDLRAFTIDETNVIQLDEMLHGRDIPELLYVACTLAGIEARKAKMKDKTLTTLALEDIFDPSDDDDIIITRDYVDELVREINEDPSILDLDKTSGYSAPGRTKRKAKAHSSFRWPATIPYIISSDFNTDADTRRAIADGIQNWQDETCLRFQKKTSYRGPHIIFNKRSGCTSFVGMVDNVKGQEISLGTNCGKKGIVAHEIGHAIGFRHEHQRPDRDMYVNIHTRNIKSSLQEKNFFKRKWDELFTLGIPYDYSSVMHYTLYYFSKNKNKLNTLSAKDTEMNSVIGQRVGLSFYDVKLANYIYCKDKCSQGLAWSACQNDGYRDPKDCSRCRCPDGWTGRYCTDLKPGVNAGCGATSLTASTSWKTLKSPNYDTSSYPANSECTWRIKTYGKNTIRLKFTEAFNFPCVGAGRGPCVDYVEVRYKDMSKAGPRYCCSTRPTQTLVSHGNEILLLLRASSGFRAKGFSLQYRLESCGGCSVAASRLSAPACVDTQTYMCNATYSDCTRGRCVTRYRHNTCYKEVRTCCDDFKLIRNTCYRMFSPWTSWTRCSKTCGSGGQTRSRRCIRPPCSGRTVDRRACSSNTCSGGQWSGWFSWTRCSKTCGSGSRKRIRRCLKPPCSGVSTSTQTCNTIYCPGKWSNWYGWSSCSRTCGTGSRTRSRRCLRSPCSGPTTDRQVCASTSCSGGWSNWYGWSTCSKTCGSGTRRRNRRCLKPPCSGLTYSVQACNTNYCPGQWSNWYGWSSCSKTCGSGSRSRSRRCLRSPCSGSTIDRQNCYSSSCPGQWSGWYGWSTCSKTCGSGTRRRNRRCLKSPCSGLTYSVQACNTNSCPGQWSNWYGWSSCSKTCGSGYRSRSRRCLRSPCSGSTIENQNCYGSSCPGQWSGWYGWSTCSKTCGSGTRRRNRRCLKSPCSGLAYSVQACNTNYCPGQWSNWYGWSSCSKTCGSGSRSRSRRCLRSPCSGSTIDRQNCYSSSCPGQWSGWYGWSTCSKTCGSGTRRRNRRCLKSPCSGLTYSVQACNTNSCPVGQWSNWYGWSSCSKTCGSGYRSRSRRCLRSPCSGSTIENQNCYGSSCLGQWSNWYGWSSCSKTCGSGYRTRKRTCLRSPCRGSSTYQQTCTQRACPKTKRCSYKARCGGWWNWPRYCTRYRTC